MLKVKLKNCYGIPSLEKIFSFDSCVVHSIYAANGFMKTSFAKTLKDYSTGATTKDVVFPERPTSREILDENDAIVDPTSLFVIEPYNQDFSSEKASTLLVNAALKRQYDEALVRIDEKRDELVKKLKQLSGLTGRTVTPETEISTVFDGKTLLDLSLEPPVFDASVPSSRIGVIVYASLFNDKTTRFLESSDVKAQIQEYIGKYNELVTQSPILNKKFNHVQAKGIHKSLGDSGFFSARHSVSLFNGTNRDEFQTAEELDTRIESEKQRILANPDLARKFDGIDKKLSNAELRTLRDYLFDNQDILTELADTKKLRRNLFAAYLEVEQALFTALKDEYQFSKAIIEEAIRQAKVEYTSWKAVVEQFNCRFTVPFSLSIGNQADVILKGTKPEIEFTFAQGGDSRSLDRNSLIGVLSQGERRALYILNILFEINARMKANQPTLLIIDDIADSFDYRNKYAIVEYLKEVAQSPGFNTIFLTHNFDFHRTISSRLGIIRENRYLAFREDTKVALSQEKYQKDPFSFWKNKLDQPRYLISSIPFLRNLAAYCGYETAFSKMTSVLHMKSDSASVTVNDIEGIIRLILKDKATLTLPNPDAGIIPMVETLAEEILTESHESAELESKIILSIAIRHMAESLMIRKINDQPFVDAITENQTFELFRKFTSLFPSETETIRLLDEVNIMTPENIHLNSFMYEPILDMAPSNLKTLYTNLKNART
jgi:energy-coupling factor transporter ATP-binding protein EcfA2